MNRITSISRVVYSQLTEPITLAERSYPEKPGRKSDSVLFAVAAAAPARIGTVWKRIVIGHEKSGR